MSHGSDALERISLDEAGRLLLRQLEAAGCIERDCLYKIRRRSDGLYSTGGSVPRWKRSGGKIWKKASHLTLHLNEVAQCVPKDAEHPYAACDVVELVLIEVSTRQITKDIESVRERRAARGRA